MPRVTKTRFVIAVRDLKVSSAFYKDVLGFEIHPMPHPGLMIYSSGNCTIMAGECRDAIPPAELGDHSYFAYLEIAEIDAFYQEIISSGTKICKTIRTETWGVREFGLVTADGHRIMFACPATK
ncbi:MAG: bleomycin resistance protein [Acidobacteria bacterium]|nr:MAG: bleomycin resistance protein [Acidobacteriota bacterium]